jgi:tRNA pseudouridine(55) synthase
MNYNKQQPQTRPPRRDVDGILLLDKPAGLTSNRALQVAKRLFAARKAGHTGSLDPLATGLLPLCFGEATKVSSFLLDADKGYRVRCRLGAATATGDADGEVIKTAAVPALKAADVETALAGFRGRIRQTPPMYSALKHEGRRLYELAREGKEVERKPREIEIRELRLVELAGGDIEYDVRCSKGTYVRTLSEDIARAGNRRPRCRPASLQGRGVRGGGHGEPGGTGGRRGFGKHTAGRPAGADRRRAGALADRRAGWGQRILPASRTSRLRFRRSAGRLVADLRPEKHVSGARRRGFQRKGGAKTVDSSEIASFSRAFVVGSRR